MRQKTKASTEGYANKGHRTKGNQEQKQIPEEKKSNRISNNSIQVVIPMNSKTSPRQVRIVIIIVVEIHRMEQKSGLGSCAIS